MGFRDHSSMILTSCFGVQGLGDHIVSITLLYFRVYISILQGLWSLRHSQSHTPSGAWMGRLGEATIALATGRRDKEPPKP